MNDKVKIIAEAGLNHNGDFKKLIKLIDIAKMANADFVKFQLFQTKYFINKKFSHKIVDYKKVYKRFQSLEFSFEEWQKAIQYGNKIGIRVFFSIFDRESLKFLKRLKINLVKIPSGEINNYDLLRSINRSKFKVILSTGMSNLNEIQKALVCLRNCKVILLHCVSEYPTINPNLNNIKLLKIKFKKETGYSDHTPDILTPAFSVLAGAKYIEKHFTYNKNQKIGDHKFSLNPKELKLMVKNIKLAEMSMGLKIKTITKKEKNLQFFARKGLYLNNDKVKGEKIKYSDLSILRPEGFLSVDKLNLIINKKSRKNIKSYTPLKFSHFRK